MRKRNPNSTDTVWWIVLYIPGAAAGLTGLISLVVRAFASNHNIKIIPYVFGGVAGFPEVVAILIATTLNQKKTGNIEEDRLNGEALNGALGFAVEAFFLSLILTGILAAL